MTAQAFFNWSERTHLFDRLRWNWTQDEGRQETVRGRIAIVGLPGVGKKPFKQAQKPFVISGCSP